MPRINQRSTLTTLFLAAAVALPITAFDAGAAQADVTVQVNGSVKVRVKKKHRRTKRVRIRTRHRRHRTHHPRVRLRIGGGIHIHGSAQIGDFAEPPPPPPPPAHACDDHVPAYYTDVAPPPPPLPPVVYRPRRYRVAPPPPPMPAQAEQPRLPRFALGAFAGGINVENRVAGEDYGLFGRLRLTDKFLVEAEMASSKMMEIRTDRRLGGALLYDLSPRSRFSAHLLAGAGVTHTNVQDGTFETKQEYGELGAGLNLRLTDRLHLSADLRAGARTRVDGEPEDVDLKNVAPSADEREKYTRGRISAVFYF